MTMTTTTQLNDSLDTAFRRACLVEELYERSLEEEEAPSLFDVRSRCYSQAVRAAYSWTPEELADWFHNDR